MWNVFSKLSIGIRFLFCFVAILLLKLAKGIEHIEQLIQKRIGKAKPLKPVHNTNRLILDNRVKYYQNMWQKIAANK